tara:strand:+ start:8417 stop:8833 length:417 start_codon:yes stop_codon:yes gene_type:complete
MGLAKQEFDECIAGHGFSWNEDWIKLSLLEHASQRGQVLLVSTIDSIVVGFVAGLVIPWIHDRSQKVAIETGWYVAPAYRGTTIGIRLWRAWEKWASLSDADIIYCAHPTHKPEVGKILDKMGYKPLETYYTKEINNV